MIWLLVGLLSFQVLCGAITLIAGEHGPGLRTLLVIFMGIKMVLIYWLWTTPIFWWIAG